MYLADKADEGDVKDDLAIKVKGGTYYVIIEDGKLAEAVKIDNEHPFPDNYTVLGSEIDTTPYSEANIYTKNNA